MNCLRRSADTHWRQVHGIILDIVGADVACLVGIRDPLAQDVLNASPATNRQVCILPACLVKRTTEEVSSTLCWGEAVLPHEVDIRLGPRLAVVGIGEELDPGGHCDCGCSVEIFAG